MRIGTILLIGFLACFSNIYAQGGDVFSQYNLLFENIKNPDKAIQEEKNNLSGIDNDTGKIAHQLILIQAYQLKNYPDSAYIILKQCHKSVESNPRKYCDYRDYWWVAQTYYSQKQKDKVQWWLDSALTRVRNSAELNLRQAYASAFSAFYEENNNFNLAIKYQSLADSLLLTILQEDFKAKQDSTAAIITGLKDSLTAITKRLNQKQTEFEEKSNYWLMALAGTIFLLICFIIYFFISGRKKKKMPGSNKATIAADSLAIIKQDVSEIKLKSDITNIYGLTALLLDKARGGDDLTYLKALQNKAFEIFLQLRPDAPNVGEETDNDKIIRRLKGIRVLIVSADSTFTLMLKEYLKKKIRLCTINAIGTAEGIDTTQADVIIGDDIQNKLDHYTTVPVIHISSDRQRGIRKPFLIDELLQALMDVYEPSAKNDIEIKEDLRAEDIAGKEPLSKLESLNKEFSEARLSKDKKKIILVVQEIRKNIEDTSNKKWFETVLVHHEELSDLQLELALRNIQTFLQRRM